MTLPPRGPIYAALGTVGLVLGIALVEPAAAAIGAAFLVPLAASLAAPKPSLPATHVSLSKTRALEGERVVLRLALHARRAVGHLDVQVETSDRLALTGNRRRILSLEQGERRTLEYELHCSRWGVFHPGRVQLRASGTLGLCGSGEARPAETVLRVYPRLEQLRQLVAPRQTRLATGSRTATTRGEGIEFAELRPLAAGERARRINWRASAARGTLLVTDRHPERSTEIVIFLDSLTAPAHAGESTLDHAVRAAATLAHGYLRRRDRVGLLRFGGDLEWVLPGSTPRQLYRLVDAVLESEAGRTYRWRDTSLIPRRVLPPQSLVVALSPLVDWYVARALLNLRRRGFDLAIIEVDPIGFALDERERHGELAWRTWLLERDMTRSRLAAAGVSITRWRPNEPIAAVIENLEKRR